MTSFSQLIKSCYWTALTLFLAMCSFSATAQDADPYPDYLEEVFMDMSFEENLETPAVPANMHTAVTTYMRNTAAQFQKKLPDALKKVITVDMTRNGESFIVTYPIDELFNPNDTLLSKYADRSLQELLPLMKDPYQFKVVYSVNSDNTGSESYRFSLTDTRMNSLYDWLLDKIDEHKIPEEIIIIPESSGSTRQIANNLTRENRRKNRRVEFYFIPGPRLLENLQENK